MQTYFKQKKNIKIKDKLCINKAKIFYELFAYNNKLFKKKLLPFGWHWLYFLENTPLYELGDDGHPPKTIKIKIPKSKAETIKSYS